MRNNKPKPFPTYQECINETKDEQEAFKLFYWRTMPKKEDFVAWLQSFCEGCGLGEPIAFCGACDKKLTPKKVLEALN